MKIKQIRVPYIGSFINVLFLTMPLFGIFAYGTSFATLYTVNVLWINEHISWLNFPLFILIVIIGCLMLMGLNYIFLYPSYYKFLNSQVYKHDNPMQRDLQLIKKKVGITSEDEENLQ